MSGTHDLIVAAFPVALGIIGIGLRRGFRQWQADRAQDKVQRTVAEIVLGYDDDHTSPPTHVSGLGDRITYLSDEVAAMQGGLDKVTSGQDRLTAKVEEVLLDIGGPHGIAHRSERGVSLGLYIALTLNQAAARAGQPEPFDLNELLGPQTAPERLPDLSRGHTDEGNR